MEKTNKKIVKLPITDEEIKTAILEILSLRSSNLSFHELILGFRCVGGSYIFKKGLQYFLEKEKNIETNFGTIQNVSDDFYEKIKSEFHDIHLPEKTLEVVKKIGNPTAVRKTINFLQEKTKTLDFS